MSTIDLYHYARSEDLDSISDEGIQVGSKYFMFDVPSRNTSAYLWRFPDEDVMGYDENPRYILLRARVEAAKVKIAPMDLISAAYANHIGRGQSKNPDVAARLIAAYEKAQVPYLEYEHGKFRTPEALVEGGVDADDIAVIKIPEAKGKGEGNRRAYASKFAEHMIRLLGIQKTQMKLNELSEAALNRGAVVRVAKHDDAIAYLETYMILETGEFYTIEKED
ncbi:MAG: hypothetical protein B6D41_12580 [Chloroflexi bacterium UTCFX4]|nr:MAG: hypothetical protein B6D41_12580 [Chloroflexi bacterium UTCFX4]